jgi:hypothetical protein
MASLNAAKQQLRSAMKLKLGAIPRESAISQSTTFPLTVEDRGSWAKVLSQASLSPTDSRRFSPM